VEIANMKHYYLQDSVALTKFIYWVKNHPDKESLTEISAGAKLDSLRAEIPGFIELSFPTISAYQANAAMMHYDATEENQAHLAAEGFYLVDSGGQYMGATTDVTRTISLGALTENQKKHYTLTALGMLDLADAVWLYGCTGRNLDILARMRLWKDGIDYKCGTGHGIGYILNVHEGPQNLRWKFTGNMSEALLEAGMAVSNEPGVYLQGEYGIRIENVLLTKNTIENINGQFMAFDNLTFVPLDRAALDTQYMNSEDLMRVNKYQKDDIIETSFLEDIV
jgi:Xaa-Pro aminopeptidase